MENLTIRELKEDSRVSIPYSTYIEAVKALRRRDLFKRASSALGGLLAEIRGLPEVEEAIKEFNKRPIEAKIAEDPDAQAQIVFTDEENTS